MAVTIVASKFVCIVLYPGIENSEVDPVKPDYFFSKYIELLK